MLIRDLIQERHPFLSLEFFPPKERETWEEFFGKAEQLRLLSPLFVSITCGAGGSPQTHTLEIASKLKNGLGLETMPHLTCIGGARETVESSLRQMAHDGIENVLALRGDPPRDRAVPSDEPSDFLYASDLVGFIRERFPGFGIGVAGYPGTHPESPTIASDLVQLKGKMDRGADFLITQFFFDNRVYFDFVRRLGGLGVDKPIIPGVLPVLSLKSLRHILSISGASIPGRLYLDIEKAHEKGGAEAVRKMGIAIARKQIEVLLEGGVPGIHLYTLNNATATREIARGFFD